MSTMRREYDDYEMESEYEEEGSEVEYEEEEDHKPNPEEAEYLELRERLKEQIRKKMKQESGSSITTSSSYSKISSSRNNNHGSFFGPSRRSISDRVIQESRSLLDNPDLANKVFKSNNPKPKSSSSGSASVGSKPRPNISAPKAINGVKKKVEILKTTRDYSFLLSDNAEMPAPVKERKPYQSVSAPAKDRRPIEDPRYAKSSQQRVRESVNESGRKVQENRDIRRFKPSSSNQTSSQSGGKVSQIAKQMSLNGRTLTDPRSKGNGPANGSGPGRALVEKGVPSRIPQRKICAPEGRRVVSSSGPTKMQVSGSKKPVMVQRRVVEEPYKPRPVQKQGIVSSSSKTSQIVRGSQGSNVSRMEVKRKPIRREEAPKRRYNDEDEEAMNMLRQMTQTRYDPRRYQDEDDDSDMEAGFDDILREEKRSERIGREEDEIQAKLIEEEERRERMRKEKKRKMR